MIRLGTVAVIGFDQFEPAEWLQCYRQLGCEVVQAYRSQTSQVPLRQMQDVITAAGMPCDSLHGVFGEQFDPSSPDEAGRAFAVNTFEHEADVCKALGGQLVVVHCSTVRRDGVSPAEKDVRIRQLKKSIEQLGRFGQSCQVTYAFENMPGYHAVGYDVAELAQILTDVAAPNTGMCFDCGHANMVGDPVAAVADAAGQIVYCHISDNSGQADDHEMLTCGTIDADALARALHQVGFDQTFMLEVFQPIDRLRELIADGVAERLGRILRIANGQE